MYKLYTIVVLLCLARYRPSAYRRCIQPHRLAHESCGSTSPISLTTPISLTAQFRRRSALPARTGKPIDGALKSPTRVTWDDILIRYLQRWP
jgi:hypothetical protein